MRPFLLSRLAACAVLASAVVIAPGCSNDALRPADDPPRYVEFAPALGAIDLPASVQAGARVEGNVSISLSGCEQAVAPLVESVTPAHFRVRVRASRLGGKDVVCVASVRSLAVPFDLLALNQGRLTIDVVGLETRTVFVQVLP